MKLLWVKSGGLLPLDTGGKIRSYNLAKELATNHELDLFLFYPEIEQDPHSELDESFAHVICTPLKIPERASLHDQLNYCLNVFSGRPHSMTKFCRPEAATRLREHLREHKYDAIICDFLLTAAVIPWELFCPKIVFTHNVETVIWKRRYEVTHHPFWKAISWREYRTMDKMERYYLQKADNVLTVSKTDQAIFSQFLPLEKMTVIETGVDVDHFRPGSNAECPFSMVFTGSMDWAPNEDAIEYFAQQILPRIRAKFPEAFLTVVGRSPSARLQALATQEAGLRITGRVEDIRPYVRDSAVYVVPLRIGGGTRIKIFEAMAMGKAVVSTSIGAEGLPVAANEHLILADTPAAFGEEVMKLFEEKALRSRLGHAARRLVESRYSWASVAKSFDSVFERLGSTHPGAPLEVEAQSIQ